MFHDATLLHHSKVKKLLKDNGWNDNDTFFEWTSGTYIVVSKEAPLSGDDAKNRKIKEEAYHRAVEIITGLSLPLLGNSDFSLMPSLGLEVHNSGGDESHAFSSNGRYIFTQRHTHDEYVINLPSEEEKINFNNFCYRQYLKRSPHKWFVQIMLSKSVNRSPLQQLIVDSATNFYKTVNTPSLVMQFLGAFTSIEMILNHGKHDKIDLRCRLLMQDLYSLYFKTEDGKTIAQLRNNITHHGKLPSEQDVFKAIRSAWLILMACSSIADTFDHREVLCQFIDVINLLNEKKKNITEGKLGLSKRWRRSIFNKSCQFDWVETRLVKYYGLNKLQAHNKSNFEPYFTMCVYDLAKLRAINKKEAFERIARLLWSCKPPFRDVSDLDNYASQNEKNLPTSAIEIFQWSL